MNMKANETKSTRKGFFRQPRAIRASIYLPVVLLLCFLGLRQLEFMVTYHPVGYIPGPEWTPPANGEDVWINVPNAERIHGWFLRSTAQPPIATILYCHGNGGNLTNVAWVAQELNKKGFDALVFDYRGYGRSDGKLSDEWGLYADAEAAYDYLLRERGVKAENLVIHGQSLGSTAAIDLASRRSCGALIVESGLSSGSDMGRVAFPWLPEWLHGLAKNRFESGKKIAKANCPALVAHGTADVIIPVDQGRRLFEAAREPKKLIIVEGGDHFLFNGGESYINQVAGFVRQEITGRQVP